MNKKLPIAIRGILSTAILLLVASLLNTTPVQSAPTAGTLSIVNDLIKDNGGSLNFSDFEFSTNGGSDWIPFEGDGQNDLAVENATYNIIGKAVTGYSTSYTDCTDVVISDDTATCTITNDDIAPKLTLFKDPTNDNGGTALADDFLLTIGGVPANSGVAYELTANIAYAIDETLVTGYSFDSISGHAKCPSTLGGTITLAEGDDITCTIVNDDDVPYLTLSKSVINDNGGTAIASDWTLSAAGPTPISGPGGAVSGATFEAGTYILSETGGPVGYEASEWVCIGGSQSTNQITIALGESVSCSITNKDFARLTLVKDPTNDNGGTALPDDFLLTVNGTPVVSGVATEYQINDPLVINETLQVGYEFVEITDDGSGKCPAVLGGTVTLALGDDVTCTIVNDDVPTIVVNPTGNLETQENGTTDTFTVVLKTEPASEVIISINSSNTSEGVVDESLIRFNSANWNVPKPVKVTGIDDFVVDGDVAYHINLDPSSSVDAGYQALDSIQISATNFDAPSIEWVKPVGNNEIYFMDNFNPIVLEVRNPGEEPIYKVEIIRYEPPPINDWDTIADFFTPPYRITVSPDEFNIEWNELGVRAWSPPGDQRFSSQPSIFIYKGYGTFLPFVSR